MKTHSLSATILMVAVALAAAACTDPQQVSDIKAKVDEIQAEQRDQLAKLDKKLDDIAKAQKDLAARPAAPAGPAAAAAEDPNKVYDVKAGQSYAKGPANAPVTIVEWSDFQCPFCAQAATLVKQITDAYPNDVKVVFKNYPLPFHNQAMPAAKAAVAAGKQGKFWEMHDKLFENARSLSEENFVKFAGEIGLDVEKFKTDMAAPETAALVTEEMKEAGTVGVRGTPTFFINGKKPSGRSFELYKSIIDEEIKKKKG